MVPTLRLQFRVICQEPASTGMCATCAAALGVDAEGWLREEGPHPLTDGR
jgi:hypothetical protein